MNCVNHPENPVSAYCQNCGKPLCAECVRNVSGVIYCEPCLAERLGIGAASAPGAGAPGVFAEAGPNPAVAFVLGFIPGVGAFYNGQFIKGLVHVLVFVILVGITNHVGIFGILIAAWVAYQVFDAYHTARARREGLPLPDPFGLNEFGARFGIPNPSNPKTGPASGRVPGTGSMPPPNPAAPPVSGFAPPAAFVDPSAPPYSDVSPPGAMPPGVMPPPVCGAYSRRRPTVAVILIILGVLFLLNSMNFFNFNWFGKLWPVLIIVFGAFLFLDRSRKLPPPTQGGPQ